MTWNITGTGHGHEKEDLIEAFEVFVRTVNAKANGPDSVFVGRIFGSTWVGDDEEGREGFVLTSDEVRAA